MSRRVVFAVVVGVAGVCVALSARQATQQVPGPGTGIVAVRGVVEIANVPSVNAVQQGDWRVISSIATMPPVTVAAAEFLRRGGRYTIVWTAGERETVTIEQIAAGGWVRVASGRARWINLASARTVEEMP